MTRCPVCHGRVLEDETCNRCKSDLSKLLCIEKEAGEFLLASIYAIKVGDLEGAYQAAYQSNHLKKNNLATAILEFGDKEA